MTDEAFLKEKPPARRQQPSRLRHEIHQDSTDDERASKQQSIQVLNSQTVIPETQLGHAQNIDKESDYGEPLTPTSAAVIENYGVKKVSEKAEPVSFGVMLFSKNWNSSQPEPQFMFSSQGRKAAQVVPDNVQPKSSHPTLDIKEPEGQKQATHGSRANGECRHFLLRCVLISFKMAIPLSRPRISHQPQTRIN